MTGFEGGWNGDGKNEREKQGEGDIDTYTFLVIVLDVNPFGWAGLLHGEVEKKDDQLKCESERRIAKLMQCAVDQILVYVNAFLSLHENNRVSIIGTSSSRAKLLFPASVADAEELHRDGLPDGVAYADLLRNTDQFHEEVDSKVAACEPQLLMARIAECVKENIEDLLEYTDSTSNTRMSAALSLALCVINRARVAASSAARAAAALVEESTVQNGTAGAATKSTAPTLRNSVNARILSLVVSDDVSSQYVPIMNCIFSAQRMEVLVDACVLRASDQETSKFFQQAAYTTGGVYLNATQFQEKTPHLLLPYLIGIFLVDPAQRKILKMPRQDEVDFRATCFLTKKTINLGWTCSVCLSTFSAHNIICPTCGTKFKLSQKALNTPAPRPPLPNH